LNKTLLDSDIYSDIRKASNATVIHNARAYRQSQCTLTNSAITVMG